MTRPTHALAKKHADWFADFSKPERFDRAVSLADQPFGQLALDQVLGGNAIARDGIAVELLEFRAQVLNATISAVFRVTDQYLSAQQREADLDLAVRSDAALQQIQKFESELAKVMADRIGPATHEDVVSASKVDLIRALSQSKSSLARFSATLRARPSSDGTERLGTELARAISEATMRLTVNGRSMPEGLKHKVFAALWADLKMPDFDVQALQGTQLEFARSKFRKLAP